MELREAMIILEKLRDAYIDSELVKHSFTDEYVTEVVKKRIDAIEAVVKAIQMDERIKKIADYYGYESQMDMLCEECGEFVQARNKLRRNVDGAYQNCLEEIADIAIMIEQMKLICGADRINAIMNEKLDRQIQRIEDENK